MAFKINHPNTRTNGTSLQGYLDITYQELEIILGEPNINKDNSLAHWTILGSIHSQTVVATIYDYSNNRVKNVERITNWHIGGYDQRSLTLVRRAIELANIKSANYSR